MDGRENAALVVYGRQDLAETDKTESSGSL